MASQTLKGFNRKYVASKQKIELPKFITEDELEDIIGQPPGYKTITRKRSSGRATSLAEVRKQASTPSPNQKKVASFFKARNSPYEEIDSGKRKLLRNTENLDANYTSKLSQLTNKYQRSKHKNTQMKEDIKMMQARYESELSTLHKENEKLVHMNKRIRKDHLDQQETLHEEILHLRKDLDYAHTELYKYIGTFKNILENIISKQITLDNSQENLTSKINESITYFNSQVEQLVKRMPRYNFENCFIKL